MDDPRAFERAEIANLRMALGSHTYRYHVSIYRTLRVVLSPDRMAYLVQLLDKRHDTWVTHKKFPVKSDAVAYLKGRYPELAGRKSNAAREFWRVLMVTPERPNDPDSWVGDVSTVFVRERQPEKKLFSPLERHLQKAGRSGDEIAMATAKAAHAAKKARNGPE